jgi:hypothetical protein
MESEATPHSNTATEQAVPQALVAASALSDSTHTGHDDESGDEEPNVLETQPYNDPSEIQLSPDLEVRMCRFVWHMQNILHTFRLQS